MPYSRVLSVCILFIYSIIVSGTAIADDLKDIAQQASQGQESAAMDRLNAHISANPTDVQALFMRGVMLADENHKDEAIKAFTELTEKYPALPEPYNNLAVLYADQGQYEKARKALESAIKTHPSYAIAHENLGDIYAKMASEAYGKALQLDGSNARAQNKLMMIKDLFSVSNRNPQQAATATASSLKPVLSKPENATPIMPIRRAEVTKPIEPKSAEPENPAKDDTQNKPDSEAIRSAVVSWANAWSAKHVDTYLSAYASSFKAPDGQNRTEWEKTRRDRIDKPEKIVVEVSNLHIIMIDNNHAKAAFKQYYHSGSLSKHTVKSLFMVKEDGSWLIQQEITER